MWLELLGSILLIIGIWFGFITIKSSKELSESTMNFLKKFNDIEAQVDALNKRIAEQTDRQAVTAIQFKEHHTNLNNTLVRTICQERELLSNHWIDMQNNITMLENKLEQNNTILEKKLDQNESTNSNLSPIPVVTKEDLATIDQNVAKFTGLIEKIVRAMDEAMVNDNPELEEVINILNKQQQSTETLISRIDSLSSATAQQIVNSTNHLETMKELDIVRNDSISKIMSDLSTLPETIGEQLNDVKTITENVLKINLEISENSSHVMDNLVDNYKVLNTIVDRIM
ncbi:hypothetical protein AN643_02240 [Candidatus Epulonipiscioides saccharophilum]|nr:hypothetical protein AN643_02240 [Epulopiscium sp. SCG-B10WGA-EpuloB]